MALVRVLGADGVALVLFESALLFFATTAGLLVADLPTVGNGDIDGVAGEDNDAVGIDPKHEDEQGADGTVKDVVVVEVVDVNLEGPGEAEDEEGGEYGADGEEIDALFLDGCNIVEQAESKHGKENEQQPAPEAESEEAEAGFGHEVAAYHELDEELVANKE